MKFHESLTILLITDNLNNRLNLNIDDAGGNAATANRIGECYVWLLQHKCCRLNIKDEDIHTQCLRITCYLKTINHI